MDIEKLGVFYLGTAADHPVLFPSNDLTTHAVCIGMTGSGKTGLCLGVLEEAAIDGIPVIAIDPKGDLGNLLLTFPALRPEDFAPWVDPDAARRKGITVEALAAEESAKWQKGLSESGQGGERIARLRAAAELALYTPGSDAGIPIAMLRSFEAPSAAIRGSAEALRQRVESTASAVLALAGVDADPVKSREHVLLANLLGQAWAAGRGFDLAGLVMAVQNPPFSAIGVLDLETFYPKSERFELVMALNNLLASPSAAALMRGEPLDVDSLLYTREGKPRVSVLSIAHLGEAERKAFVTLLLGNLVSWMRAQPGTSSLRALLFMDEVAGYLPPVANPPTKPLFLTLFKQARAYGLGVVVATQNPVDVDYKVLSNAGTWLVGRLQTARDRARVLEGLTGAAEGAGGAADARSIEKVLGDLQQRQFLVYSARGTAPYVMQSRWTLSYLRGPLSLSQIERLPKPATTSAAEPSQQAAENGRPLLDPDITQIFVPVASAGGEALAMHVGYAPCVLGAARVRHVDKKLGIDTTTPIVVAAEITESMAGVDWSKAWSLYVPLEALGGKPAPQAIYQAVSPAGADASRYRSWKKAFGEHLTRAFTVEVLRCDEADLVSSPGESERDFRIRLGVRLHEMRDEQLGKLRDKYAVRVRSAEEKVRKQLQAIEKHAASASQKKTEAAIGVGVGVLGALFGTKLASAANVQRAGRAVRGVKKAADSEDTVERAREDLAAAQETLGELEAEIGQKAQEIASALDPATVPLTRAMVTPKKTHIEVAAFGLGWLPYRPGSTGQWEPAWAPAQKGW
jgi:hypothetical protein